MDLNNIIYRIIDIINSNIDDENCKLISETMIETLEINSITFINIIIDIENEFDFQFDDEYLSFTAFLTIKSLSEYVLSKIQS